MARSRNIKPGFFINDDLGQLEPLARLLFIGLWTIADREGRLEDKPLKIKIQTLPYDDCDIDYLLDQLAANDEKFITRYEVEGKRYIQITNWKKHQNPHIKESASEIPAKSTAPNKHHTSTMLAPNMHRTSPADSLNLIPDSLNPLTDSGETVVVVDSDEWNQINKQYAKCFGSVLTPNNVKMLESYLSDGLTIWHIQEALKITLENKGKSIKYVQGILNTWLSKKAFTRSDVEAISKSYVKPTKTTQVFGDDYVYEQRERPAAGFEFLNDDEGESNE